MEYKRLLRNSLKTHSLLTDIFGYMLVKTGFANKYTAGLITLYKSYDKVNKRYGKYVGTANHEPSCKIENKNVWICWWQGIDNAPKIVKLCHDSVCKWMDGWNIIVIDRYNYHKFVSFPDFIIDKWNNGTISNTHMSDLLRLELIVRYGGLWIDATTLMTGPLPSYVTNKTFFVYRNGWMDHEMINMASWLIYSFETHNIMLEETLNLLYIYWKQNNYIKNYFLLHIFFRMVSDAYPEVWSNVNYINHIDQHLLINECKKKSSKERINEILNLTSVHKLTYKEDNVYSFIKRIMLK